MKKPTTKIAKVESKLKEEETRIQKQKEEEVKVQKPKEDDSVLLGSATADKSNDINKAALNSSLTIELDKINESLLKIGLMLNVSSFHFQVKS